VVRDTKTLDELIESTGGIIMSPEQLRAQRRLFAYGNTAIENPDGTRDIVARADADFERIFGSE
jgi:hypothetical protein